MTPEERKAARDVALKAIDALDEADKDVRTALILAAAKQRQVDERDALLREFLSLMPEALWFDDEHPANKILVAKIRAIIGEPA